MAAFNPIAKEVFDRLAMCDENAVRKLLEEQIQSHLRFSAKDFCVQNRQSDALIVGDQSPDDILQRQRPGNRKVILVQIL